MDALTKSDFTATITWLGHVADRKASLRARAVNSTQASFAGLEGETHGGLTRPSCTRVKMLHPKGTEIRNTRQLSILSAEELALIAAELRLDHLDPSLLGASMVVAGIPDFTHIPPASRLQAPSGATLTVDLENASCKFPGQEIEAEFPGHGKGFKAAAANRRGLTAWVECPGTLSLGDTLTLFVPTQRAWAPQQANSRAAE